MNILEFIKRFLTETSCKEHFRAQREVEGIKCKHCSSSRHYWLQAKWKWQCIECDFRTRLKSGSIKKAAKVSVRTWYLAMAFMTFSKKSFSASELQRPLDHPKYDTVWRLMASFKVIIINVSLGLLLQFFSACRSIQVVRHPGYSNKKEYANIAGLSVSSNKGWTNPLLLDDNTFYYEWPEAKMPVYEYSSYGRHQVAPDVE